MSQDRNLEQNQIVQTAQTSKEPNRVKYGYSFIKTPEETQDYLHKMASYMFDIALSRMDDDDMDGYKRFSAVSDMCSELESELLRVRVY